MRKGLAMALVLLVILVSFLGYAWMHRATRTFTGSVLISFDWNDSRGFKNIAVEWPHWGPLYSRLIANQAKPYIASEIKHARWRSAQGRLNVGAFLMLFVLGIDRLSDNNVRIIDPEVTPLMHAVEDGSYASAARLISEGVDVNAQDQRGWTALMHASMSGHSEEAALLLASGADLNTKDKDGRTAFLLAAQNCRSDVALLLANAGADVNVRDRFGYSAMDSTICPEFMKEIVEHATLRGNRP